MHTISLGVNFIIFFTPTYLIKFLAPLKIALPILRSRPCLDIGMPVARAIFCLACVMPMAHFKKNEGPYGYSVG
jgi:hypothetical protein